MLVGRDPERLALRRVLANAWIGHSGVLGLVGEPGIGKTALLEDARELAEGMQILRARGIESEADVPFAGLLELLRPVERVEPGGRLDAPHPRRQALLRLDLEEPELSERARVRPTAELHRVGRDRLG